MHGSSLPRRTAVTQLGARFDTTETETVSFPGALAPVIEAYRNVSLAQQPVGSLRRVALFSASIRSPFRFAVRRRLDSALGRATALRPVLSLFGRKVSDSFGPPQKSPNAQKAMCFRTLRRLAVFRAGDSCRERLHRQSLLQTLDQATRPNAPPSALGRCWRPAMASDNIFAPCDCCSFDLGYAIGSPGSFADIVGVQAEGDKGISPTAEFRLRGRIHAAALDPNPEVVLTAIGRAPKS